MAVLGVALAAGTIRRAHGAPAPRLAATLESHGSVGPAAAFAPVQIPQTLAPWLAPFQIPQTPAPSAAALALRELEQLEHVRVPLGHMHLRLARASLRLDGDLHLQGAWPALGAHVAFDLRGQQVAFDVPSVQLIPRAQGVVELKVVLFERHF